MFGTTWVSWVNNYFLKHGHRNSKNSTVFLSQQGLFLCLATCMTLIKIYMTPKKQNLWFHILMRPDFLSSWFQRAWLPQRCLDTIQVFCGFYGCILWLDTTVSVVRATAQMSYHICSCTLCPFAQMCFFFIRASHRKAFALFWGKQASHKSKWLSVSSHFRQSCLRYVNCIWLMPFRKFVQGGCVVFWFGAWCPTHPLKEGLHPHQWDIHAWKSEANYPQIFTVLQYAGNVCNTLLTYEYSYICTY